MTSPLRVLILEDNATDAELIHELLEADDFVCEPTRVQTRAEFVAALQSHELDLILADYTLPAFDGLSALKLTLTTRPDVPFIFVSGTIGEEVAVETLKVGATDYVLKTRLSRLVPSVRRALQEARERVERKKAEEAAHRSEKELLYVIEAIPALAFTSLADGSNAWANRQWVEYTGLSVEDTSGLGWQTTLHPADAAEHITKWQQSLATGEPFENEARHRSANNEYRWFLVRAVPLCDESGKVRKWYGTLTDIEDRKQAEALRAAEKQLFEMIAAGVVLEEILNALCLMIEEQRSASLASVLLLNPDGSHLDFVAGPSVPREWALQMEKLPIGPCAGSCGTAAYRRSRVIVSHIATDPLWDVTEHRDSALKHGLRASWSNPVLSSEGKVLGTFCMYYREPRSPNQQDLELIELATHILRVAIERDRAGEALRRSEAKLEEAQRVAHVGYWERDLDTNRISGSDETYRIFGLTPGEGTITVDGMLECIHPEDRPILSQAVAEGPRGASRYELEYRVIWPNGEVRVVHSQGDLTRDASGRPRSMFGTIQDITERKRAEAALRDMQMKLAHANRVATMGQLSASITHEIKQPIAAARNNACAALNFMDKNPPDLGEVREALGCVVGDADRAADIIDRIRDHIKKAPCRKECFDINAGIREVIELIRGESVKNGISMQADLADGLPLIEGDRVQLQQVILNLIVNAVEAMSGASDGARELLVSSRKADPVGVLIEVRDSGPGLTPETLEHVFEAFYTTKPSGWGMGLPICRSIIEAHGGGLWASGNLTRGASFHFALPAIANTAPREPS